MIGEAALGLVRSEKPDLMILDLMLPKMNGLDVCKAIRRNPDGKFANHYVDGERR